MTAGEDDQRAHDSLLPAIPFIPVFLTAASTFRTSLASSVLMRTMSAVPTSCPERSKM